MANLKKEIEDRLITSERVLQLFEAETLFDNKVKKYIETKYERIKSETEYDVHEYTVSITSRTPIEKQIHVKAIIDGTLSMQGGQLRKVIYNGVTMEERNGLYVAEISFTMVNSFEKTRVSFLSRLR